MAPATDSASDTNDTAHTAWRARLAWSLGSLAALILLWEVAALILKSRVFPGPIDVLYAMRIELATGALTHHVGATLARGEDTPETLVARADALMYRAKSEGRNRVATES